MLIGQQMFSVWQWELYQYRLKGLYATHSFYCWLSINVWHGSKLLFLNNGINIVYNLWTSTVT